MRELGREAIWLAVCGILVLCFHCCGASEYDHKVNIYRPSIRSFYFSLRLSRGRALLCRVVRKCYFWLDFSVRLNCDLVESRLDSVCCYSPASMELIDR